MAVNIQKPIDREYLLKQLEKLAGHELYEKAQKTVIDVAENYVKDTTSDPSALLVIDDSLYAPNTGEVGISEVEKFITDSSVVVGDYVIYIPEQSHLEDDIATKYASRVGLEMTVEEWEKIWDLDPKDVEVYKSLIQDQLISPNLLWSSKKVLDEIESTKVIAKEYVDKLLGKSATIKIEVVQTLPSEGATGTIYIHDDGTSFPLYVYSETLGWIATGADLATVDFEGYVKTEDIVTDTTTIADDTILSSKGTKVYVDTTLADYIKKTDLLIDTTTVSDTTVLSSKATKEYIDNKTVMQATEPTSSEDGSFWLETY